MHQVALPMVLPFELEIEEESLTRKMALISRPDGSYTPDWKSWSETGRYTTWQRNLK